MIPGGGQSRFILTNTPRFFFSVFCRLQSLRSITPQLIAGVPLDVVFAIAKQKEMTFDEAYDWVNGPPDIQKSATATALASPGLSLSFSTSDEDATFSGETYKSSCPRLT